MFKFERYCAFSLVKEQEIMLCNNCAISIIDIASLLYILQIKLHSPTIYSGKNNFSGVASNSSNLSILVSEIFSNV